MPNSEQEAQHAFERASLHLPSDKEIEKLSFAGLASLLAYQKEGTAEYSVVERAIKKRLAKDQAVINLPNMLWAAGFGGLFALAGVALGWWLQTMNSTPVCCQQILNTSTAEHIEESKFNKQSPSQQAIEPINPNAKQSAPDQPKKINTNAQPSQ